MQPPPPDAVHYVEPRPGVAKTIGILNLIFGSLLSLCVGCSGAYMLMFVFMMPAMRPMMKAQQRQVQAQFEAQRQARIDNLRKQEQATEDAKEKQALRAQRNDLEARPIPEMPDMTKMWGANQPLVIGYGLTDITTALVLNLAMIVSGIGLVRLSDWGRRLGLWVAWLKIARLVMLYAFFAIAVVPMIAKGYGEMMDEMMKAMPPPRNAPVQPMGQTIAAVYGVMLTAYAVGMVLLGAIYPIVTLWYLSRPGTKATCGAGALSEPPIP